MKRQPHTWLRRFARNSEGAMLVEFCMAMPLLLLFFAVIIEGSRLAWTYQIAAHGVRDAARMVARMAPDDLCTAGSSVNGYDDMVTSILKESLSGNSVLPNGVTVVDVTPTLRCVTGSYKVSPAPVVEVRAQVSFTYLFGGIFGFFNEALETLDAEIADQSRVYGT